MKNLAFIAAVLITVVLAVTSCAPLNVSALEPLPETSVTDAIVPTSHYVPGAEVLTAEQFVSSEELSGNGAEFAVMTLTETKDYTLESGEVFAYVSLSLSNGKKVYTTDTFTQYALIEYVASKNQVNVFLVSGDTTIAKQNMADWCSLQVGAYCFSSLDID